MRLDLGTLLDDAKPYPRWMEKALGRINEKPDDEPLTNTEAEALLRYEYGDDWMDSHD